MRIGPCAWVVAFALLTGTAARAQQTQPNAAPTQPGQEDSLAAAARRTREQKKTQTKTAAKVYSNEDLPSTGTINVVGSGVAPNSSQPGQPSSQAVASAETVRVSSAALSAAREKLASAQKDLDILQRKYNLDQQMFISNPNHDHDYTGSEALKSEQQQMNQAQDAVLAAQKEVDDLQAKVIAAGNNTH